MMFALPGCAVIACATRDPDLLELDPLKACLRTMDPALNPTKVFRTTLTLAIALSGLPARASGQVSVRYEPTLDGPDLGAGDLPRSKR